MIVKLRLEFAASSPCKGRAARPLLRAGLMSGVALFILASALDARAQQTPAAPEPSATQPVSGRAAAVRRARAGGAPIAGACAGNRKPEKRYAATGRAGGGAAPTQRAAGRKPGTPGRPRAACHGRPATRAGHVDEYDKRPRRRDRRSAGRPISKAGVAASGDAEHHRRRPQGDRADRSDQHARHSRRRSRCVDRALRRHRRADLPARVQLQQHALSALHRRRPVARPQYIAIPVFRAGGDRTGRGHSRARLRCSTAATP